MKATVRQYAAALLCLLPLLAARDLQAQPARDWWQRSSEFRTRYYNVKTDLPEQDARHLSEHMDITLEAYAQLFTGLKARRPRRLDLYLFANQRDYNATLGRRFRVNGTGSWGMAISRGAETSLVAWRGQYSRTDMESVLQHEGFHQFARYLFPKLPSWSNEGLAEVFQRGVEVDGKIVLGEVSYRDLQMLAAANKKRQFRSFAQFFTMDQRVWNQHVQRGEANVNYLQAWCLVHFFLYADEGKYQPAFMDFLVGLNQELPWQEAFVRAYGTPNFQAMEEKWLAYIEQLRPVDYRETIRRLDFLAAGMKELISREIYPLSIAELQQELENIDFQHANHLFDKEMEFQASEAKNFQVPSGIPARVKNASKVNFGREFRLVDAKGKAIERPDDEKRLERLKRRLTKQPPNLVTVGLSPKNLLVTWKRAGKKELRPVLVAK